MENEAGVYEIWSGRGESSMFKSDDQSSGSLRFHIHTVDEKPMEFVCKFYSPNWDVSVRYMNMLLYGK